MLAAPGPRSSEGGSAKEPTSHLIRSSDHTLSEPKTHLAYALILSVTVKRKGRSEQWINSLLIIVYHVLQTVYTKACDSYPAQWNTVW